MPCRGLPCCRWRKYDVLLPLWTSYFGLMRVDTAAPFYGLLKRSPDKLGAASPGAVEMADPKLHPLPPSFYVQTPLILADAKKFCEGNGPTNWDCEN